MGASVSVSRQQAVLGALAQSTDLLHECLHHLGLVLVLQSKGLVVNHLSGAVGAVTLKAKTKPRHARAVTGSVWHLLLLLRHLLLGGCLLRRHWPPSHCGPAAFRGCPRERGRVALVDSRSWASTPPSQPLRLYTDLQLRVFLNTCRPGRGFSWPHCWRYGGLPPSLHPCESRETSHNSECRTSGHQNA